MRKNVQLLFIGLSADDTDPIIRLLRASRLAPRGHQVATEAEFLEALSERSWDVILCPVDRPGEFNAKNAIHHLNRQNKDIPVIQLLPTADSRAILQALKSNISAVVPLEEKELLLLYIRRELESLRVRRELRQTQGTLSDLELRAQRLMETSSDAIACYMNGALVYANESCASLFGVDNRSGMIGTPLTHYLEKSVHTDVIGHLNEVNEDIHSSLVIQAIGLRSDETTFNTQLELTKTRFNYNEVIQITLKPEIKSAEKELSDQLDLVSGVFNTEYFNSELDTVVRRALDGGADCNLLYISLDNFVEIRSDVGLDGCDQVVRDIGDLLRKHVNRAHMIGRVDDDAFAVLFREPNPDKAEKLAHKLCLAIEGNVSESSGTTIRTTSSIGIFTISDNAPSRKEVIRRALFAADELRAQTGKGNGHQLFAQEVTLDSKESAIIEELENAIRRNRLKLLFQPVVSLTHQDEFENYEVILRLVKETGELVSPGEFLQVIDQAEITIKMDRWVMKEALIKLQKGSSDGHKPRLFVSVSNRTLQDRKTLVWFAELLRRSGIPADRLVFQISENDASAYLKYASEFTNALNKLHCGVCIKHYGSSANSENVLRQVSSRIIKIDGSYITELADGTGNEKKFLEMVTKLKANNRLVIAPMVENTRVMGTLWKAGVHLVQGNYLSPPIEAMTYDFFGE